MNFLIPTVIFVTHIHNTHILSNVSFRLKCLFQYKGIRGKELLKLNRHIQEQFSFGMASNLWTQHKLLINTNLIKADPKKSITKR